MASFKLTTKGSMTFLSVKAFGLFLNASWGKASQKAAIKAPKANAWLGEWTIEGYQRHMDAMTVKALDEVANWVWRDMEWELYAEGVKANYAAFKAGN